MKTKRYNPQNKSKDTTFTDYFNSTIKLSNLFFFHNISHQTIDTYIQHKSQHDIKNYDNTI